MRTIITGSALLGLLLGSGVADAGTSTRRRDIPITNAKRSFTGTSVAAAVVSASAASKRNAKRAPRKSIKVWGDPHVSERRFVGNTWPGGSRAATKRKPVRTTNSKVVGGAASMAVAAVPGGTILSAALSGAGKASSTAAALKGASKWKVHFKPGKTLKRSLGAKR